MIIKTDLSYPIDFFLFKGYNTTDFPYQQIGGYYMRKLLPFVLAFVIVVCLAACKDKNEPVNSNTITTGALPGAVSTPVSQQSLQSQDVGSPSDGNVPETYLLTTAADMTVPTVMTTAFNIANESVSSDPFTTQPITTDINLTSSAITAPVVNTTALPSVPTVTTTDKDDKTTGKEDESKTTSSEKETQESTTNASAKAISIVDAGVGLDGSGKRIIYSIDPSCGSFKSNSTVISVTVDGEEFDNIPCKISASNLDASGCQQVFIDLSAVEDLAEGSTVSFSVPAAFLNSKDGKTYGKSFGNTIVV